VGGKKFSVKSVGEPQTEEEERAHQKKMIIAPTATPESIAAERTSTSTNQHQSQYRLRGATRSRTVVLCPPVEMTPTDHVLEDESDDAPGNVVHSVCGRNVACAGEDDACVLSSTRVMSIQK
jgi:hypothetical protein